MVAPITTDELTEALAGALGEPARLSMFFTWAVAAPIDPHTPVLYVWVPARRWASVCLLWTVPDGNWAPGHESVRIGVRDGRDIDLLLNHVRAALLNRSPARHSALYRNAGRAGKVTVPRVPTTRKDF